MSEDHISIPLEPTDAVLRCMAITYDHGLGCPGYYDQAMFNDGPSHAERLESTITLMRKLYQDIVTLNQNPNFQRNYEPGGRFHAGND